MYPFISDPTRLPIDRVTGYTLGQVETALKDATTIDELQTNLENKVDNPTEANLNELFNNFK